MKTIFWCLALLFSLCNTVSGEETRPFWTEKSAYAEGEALYVVGVASDVKTIEEGRIKAFNHGKTELANYLMVKDLEKYRITLETQMTYEEKTSKGTYNVFRLMFTDLERLTVIQNEIIKKNINKSRELDSSIAIKQPIDRDIIDKRGNTILNIPEESASGLSPDKGSISIDIKPGNKYVLSTEEKSLFLYLKVDIQDMEVMNLSRLPLNISLVIDRSASMDDEKKIEYAKEAAMFLIDNLTQNDFLSIVAYDFETEVISPAAPVTAKNLLKHKVEQIVTGTMTNLSGGLSEGYEQVLNNYRENFINRVILLSDGLATLGITDEKALFSLVKNYRKRGVSITAVGVGTDFNENLMLGFAEYGSGSYYFVKDPEKIPEIARRELKQLLAVIAQNITISLYPEPGVEVVNTFNGGYEPAMIPGGGVRFNLGDISFGDQKIILIELKLPEQKKGKRDVARVNIKYDDIVGGRGRVKEKKDISVIYTNNARMVKSAEDQEVNSYVRLSCAAEIMHKAMKALDEGLYDETIDILRKEYDSIVEYAELYSDQWLLEKAKIFKHCADRLAKMKISGKLQDHDAMKGIKKEFHYQKYKMMIRHHK